MNLTDIVRRVLKPERKVNFITTDQPVLEAEVYSDAKSLLDIGTYLARMKEFSSNARCINAERVEEKDGNYYRFEIQYVDDFGIKQHYAINAAAIITEMEGWADN